MMSFCIERVIPKGMGFQGKDFGKWAAHPHSIFLGVTSPLGGGLGLWTD